MDSISNPHFGFETNVHDRKFWDVWFLLDESDRLSLLCHHSAEYPYEHPQVSSQFWHRHKKSPAAKMILYEHQERILWRDRYKTPPKIVSPSFSHDIFNTPHLNIQEQIKPTTLKYKLSEIDTDTDDSADTPKISTQNNTDTNIINTTTVSEESSPSTHETRWIFYTC